MSTLSQTDYSDFVVTTLDHRITQERDSSVNILIVLEKRIKKRSNSNTLKRKENVWIFGNYYTITQSISLAQIII